MLLPLAAVSCRLDGGESSHRTEDSITRYTSGVFYDMVVNSVAFLDEALCLDTYLKLPEEEQQSDKYEFFRHELRRYDENTYVLGSKVISTGGTSLTGPGSIWTLKMKMSDLYYYMYNNYYVWSGGIEPGRGDDYVTWTLACTGTDTWTVSSEDESSVSLEASYTRSEAGLEPDIPYGGSGYNYSGTLTGSLAEDPEGFSVSFSTDDFRFFYEEYAEDGSGDTEDSSTVGYARAYTVTFRLDVYKWNQRMDWCIQYTDADGTDYLTSIGNDFPLE